MVICYYCKMERSKITSATCPGYSGGHYFIAADKRKRKVPRLENKGQQLDLFRR
jgi:hypothetical protein